MHTFLRSARKSLARWTTLRGDEATEHFTANRELRPGIPTIRVPASNISPQNIKDCLQEFFKDCDDPRVKGYKPVILKSRDGNKLIFQVPFELEPEDKSKLLLSIERCREAEVTRSVRNEID
ncbi:hypothetical protein MKZ38_004084 [Zalerion maritima]|uniref:Uncharacterized protein n=1 Tax=Zalerion maritima TaxID=339359 RepID=A0AAD5RY22_9PEZI|nr:hypothetical protein MKZ38_004084 [Zalerion maritima]